MKKILVPAMLVVLSATAVTPIFAQSYRARDAHGCETWEGERWDARYGKCMDSGDYDDDYYKYHHQAVSTAPVTPVNITSNSAARYNDDAQIAKEFKSATSFVQNAGIMRGNRGYFYPKNLLTEYEALVIVARATAKTEISNFDQARAFAARLGKSFDHDDMNDRIDRGDFFELIKKAKEHL